MTAFQELHDQQIDEAIRTAVDKSIPVTVTVQPDGSDTWINLHSRLIALQDQQLFIEPPTAEQGEPTRELAPCDRIGVSFKLKHHKHVFNTVVLGASRGWRSGEGASGDALAISTPTRMQRLQRRAFQRVDVPPGKIVRGSFWLGGRKSEPKGTDVACPIWSGRVTNISAGGLQMQVDPQVTHVLDVGDVVGLRIVFGAGEAAVYADAQFRHYDDFGDRAVIGFQLVGLAETPEGQHALRIIMDRVQQYGRINPPREA
ncbi:MAG: PilZ domain-containing protein [Planctomycetota bacterium]|nr:PilZ domain-containing protein [Planctomycetota bacterium]